MGVYIRGMEMPKNDEFITVYSSGTVLKTKVLYNEKCTEYLQIGKAKEAAEVPDHGRLIDAEKLKEKWSHKNLDLFSQGWGFLHDLNQAETVIPASGGDE